MKKILLLITISISLSQFVSAQIYLELEEENVLTFEEIVAQTEAYFDAVGRGKGSGYTPFMRWKYWSARSLDINGKIITKKQKRDEYKEFSNQQRQNNKTITGSYTEMGPISAQNTSTWSSHIGRITSIAVDPNNVNHIIVGSPTGGVWKTTDKGTTWINMTDAEPNMDIWSLTISHNNSNHYFIGTGVGIRYSLNGGSTWNDASGDDDVKYNTLIMHPTDSNVLYAVAESSGRIFKSSNGGFNWVQIYDHINSMYDIEFKPGSPSTIYASGRGIIIKSDNAGASFTTLNGGWSSNGAIMLAVTPVDSDYLYALQERSGGFDALYLSEDGGNNFSVRSDNSCDCNNIMGYNQSQQNGQAPRDMDVIVSPTDKDEVHVAGVETWKAIDGGMTWNKTTSWLVNNSLPFIHADVDALYYIGNTIYAATDGGIFYSEDEASSFTDVTQGLGIRQFYRIGASQTETNRVSGGSQDNGTGIVRNNGTWYDFMGADGMETFIDFSDEDIVYGSIQFGSLYKSTNGGNTANSTAQTPGGNGAWVTPLEQDPINPTTLYQAKYEVFKSTDGASSWNAISNFNSNNLIQELAIAPSDNNVIYAAFNNTIHSTIDAGANWTDITPDFQLSNINYITVHPSNPMRIALVLSGSGAKLIESLDGGSTWEDQSANLPNLTANTMVYEGDTDDGMLIGMNPGIFYKNKNTAGTWSDVSGNLPKVRVAELEIRNNKLYVGTYGRGLWRVDLASAPTPSHYTCTQAQALSITCGSTLCSIAPDQGAGASQPDAIDAVWYAFTPERTGFVSIYSCDVTNENTRLYVHSGDCNNLTLIDSSDDVCNTQSRVDNIAVTSGTTIYIEWDNKHSNKEFEFVVEYAGTTCEKVQDIINSATYSAPDLFCFGASHSDAVSAHWYRYTPPADVIVEIYSCNGGVDTRLWVYSGDCNNLTLIDESDDSCSMGSGMSNFASSVSNISVLANTSIYIEWDNRWSNLGFDWVLSSTPIDWYRDSDNDSFGDIYNLLSQQNQPNGYVIDNSDCDDTDDTVFPGAPELCDGQLNNCNGSLPTDEIDNDNDGYVECEIDPGGWDNNATKLGGDCDDTDANINPKATEICDGIDNNCNDLVDEGLILAYYNDNDGDGYGAGNVIMTCSPTSTQVLDNTDCDDTDNAIFPGAIEICDGIDNDCDNQIDEGLIMAYYNDNDSDGYGAGTVIMTCSPTSSQVLNNTDCDDNNPNINPSESEICGDNLDNDCDGIIDNGCDDCDGVDLDINNNNIMPTNRAFQTIESDALVNLNSVLYTAGVSIELQPDFEVAPGKLFEARIQPCNQNIEDKDKEDSSKSARNYIDIKGK